MRRTLENRQYDLVHPVRLPEPLQRVHQRLPHPQSLCRRVDLKFVTVCAMYGVSCRLLEGGKERMASAPVRYVA